MIDKILFIFTALCPQEKKFDKALFIARVVVESALGVCKARWRYLLKQLQNSVENVSNVIIACFTLHNFWQVNGENYFDSDEILEMMKLSSAKKISKT